MTRTCSAFTGAGTPPYTLATVKPGVRFASDIRRNVGPTSAGINHSNWTT